MSGRTVRTTCPYCGVGCGVLAQTDGQRLIAVQGDPEHPANHGRLCVKGTALPETQLAAGRLLTPTIRGAQGTWAEALDAVASGFDEIIRADGPDAVAFYLSGQLLTEDYYVANKLMKGFIGSGNVDTNSRLCMASAVAAHKRAFGEDVVPCSYDDLDTCELIVMVGSNAAWTHPVLYQRLAARRAKGELKVVVIDPRRTATCDIADLHLRIRPGMDAALFNALLTDLADRGALDEAYIDARTEGFSRALATARRDALDAAERTGLSETELRAFFSLFAATSRTVTFFSQGVNQASNGTDKANAIINVHLATGRIGQAGMGPFSITGQPNAMGGREVGGMATQLAAHQDFEPDSLAAVRAFWRAPNLVTGPGRKAVEMFQALRRGEIKAIWIMGTNPAVSLPDANAVGRALADCPLVVVSDCMADTETTRHADVLLPAQAWGEKDGTVTNSERRLSRQRSFQAPAGEARPDWWIVTQVARRLGFGAAFPYQAPAEIFREHAALTGSATPARLLDLSELAALTDADYEALAPQQWGGQSPLADARFSTDSGRARFIPIEPHMPEQQPTELNPLVLNTGRLRDQWHTMTRTGLAPRLLGHADTPLIDMHPTDAAAQGLTDGALVEVGNGRGRFRGLLRVTDDVLPGTLFAAIHWNGRLAAASSVSRVVAPVVDPISGQPESKHVATAARLVDDVVWQRWLVGDEVSFPDSATQFATCLPWAGGRRIEFASAVSHAQQPGHPLSVVAEHDLNTLVLKSPGLTLRLLERNGQIVAAGAVSCRREVLPAWSTLEDQLQGEPSWQLLAGSGDTPTSRQICTCFEIRENEITAAIEAGAKSTTALGRKLGCGTNCGSCIPELKTLLASSAH